MAVVPVFSTDIGGSRQPSMAIESRRPLKVQRLRELVLLSGGLYCQLGAVMDVERIDSIE